MISRVAVGLMQEGVTTAIATPRSLGDPESAGLTTHVAYDDLGWQVTLKSRAAGLLTMLASEEYAGWAGGGSEGGTIDVIHAWGHAAWPMAVELARETDAAVVLDVWSMGAAEQIRRTERSAARGREEAVRGVWLAPSRGLLSQTEPRAHLWPCQMLHWGVHAPEKIPAFEKKAQWSIGVVCSGEMPEATIAMLQGIAQVAPSYPEMLVFLDEAGVANDHRVWRAAQEAGLLDRLSVIADMESRRELVLRTDLLLLPDVAGETRSIILDAMAHGVVVIADASTSSDAIIDGRTAMTVGGRGAEHWARAIRNVLDDEDTHAAIRKEAHRLILTERRGHVHVSALMRVYEGLTTGEPIAFRAAGPPHSSR